MQLLAEIGEFIQEHRGVLAMYHTFTMEELERIEHRCRDLQEEACRQGACGSAGSLA